MSQLDKIRVDVTQADANIAAAKTDRDALNATIAAAELYMRALKLTKDPSEKREFDVKCKQRLEAAEKIKSGGTKRADAHPPAKVGEKLKTPKSKKHITNRQLTTREKIILLEGSKLNGFVFPPWDASPNRAEFLVRDGQELYRDSHFLRLSPLQMKHFDGWKRPAEALTNFSALASTGTKQLPTMQREGKTDLVQDITTDCSVVASLCAGTARVERGHTKLLSSRIFPYDDKTNYPAISPSGKYVMRLRFNGCDRKVVIDDLLPTSSTSRVLHVVDRLNPTLLWPALVEKAYLKARGGYDFPGSNSGTDLAILTGWIPEQIFLHSDDVLPDALWKRILSGFKYGDVLLTIGTGKLTKKEERQLGLAREHDYAVLNLREVDGIREMLIKNPWSDGAVWKGRSRSSVNLTHFSSANLEHLSLSEQQDASMAPGTFWMDLDSVFQHFENLYLNWNPDLFTHREDIHFSWDTLASTRTSGCFVANPQFAISTPVDGDVWLQLNRHFQTETSTGKGESPNAGYISLYLYKAGGKRVFLSDAAIERGPYVDSPNTLLKVHLSANETYTLVVAAQMLPAIKQNFTLSALARTPLTFTEAEAKYLSSQTCAAAWTHNTAGGNSDFKSYVDNPQFFFSLPSAASMAILLDVSKTSPDPPAVHAKVFFSPKRRRITRVRKRDILASTGDYRRQSAVLEAHLEAGDYTVICSTFEPSQLSLFNLTVHSTLKQIQVVPVPAEAAGKLSVKSEARSFNSSGERLLAQITTSRVTKVTFIVRDIQPSDGLQPAGTVPYHQEPLTLLIEQGRGPYKTVVASSHEESEGNSAMIDTPRIEDLDIRPDMTKNDVTGGLWLAVERDPSSSSAAQAQIHFQVEALCDERVTIGRWEMVER